MAELIAAYSVCTLYVQLMNLFFKFINLFLSTDRVTTALNVKLFFFHLVFYLLLVELTQNLIY